MLRWIRDWLEDMRFVAKWDRLVAEASTDPASVKLPKRVETPDSLESAVQLLRRIGLREPKPMRPVERGGPGLEAMRLTGPLPLLRAVARKLNVPWRSAGYYVWVASGAGKFPAQIGVASTAEWAEVIRFMATCGGDTDLQDGLIAVLRELDAACPISVPEIEADSIHVLLGRPLDERQRWATRILEACKPEGGDAEPREPMDRAELLHQLARGELELVWEDSR